MLKYAIRALSLDKNCPSGNYQMYGIVQHSRYSVYNCFDVTKSAVRHAHALHSMHHMDPNTARKHTHMEISLRT
jgi:hypothetical protein